MRLSKSHIVVLVAGFVICYIFLSGYALIFAGLGLVLVIASQVIPAKKVEAYDDEKVIVIPPPRTGGNPRTNSEAQMMPIPDRWDEPQITYDIERLQRKDGMFLGYYLESIVDRFITGQDTKTMQSRLEFLKQHNEALTLAIQNKKLRAEFNRVDAEGKIAHEEVRVRTGEASDERELRQLRREAEKAELKAKIAENNYRAQNIGKTQASPPAPKKRTVQDIEAEIEATYKDDAAIDANPNMRQEDKIRRKNINANRRERLFEELENMKEAG